jgi:6-phosphogluconolactonase (cycloisomerase 2 family)
MNPFSSRLGLAVLVGSAVGLAACSDSSSTSTTTPTGAYAIGGTLAGLPSGGQLKLLNNGSDELTLSQDGTFAFATKLDSGAAYAVTVGTQPTDGTCTVTPRTATGLVSGSDIASVEVTCVATFAVGGTVTGLASGASLTLGGATAGSSTVTADGSFTLPTRLEGGAAYAVTVTTQPAGQTCSVDSGTGSIAAASVTTVAVTCGFSAQYAYVLNHGSDTITPLAITSTGVTAVTPDITAQDGPQSIATDSAGTMAAVANNWAKTISIYRINGATGALTAIGTPVATANLHPRSIAMAGSLVFVAVTDFVNDNKLLTFRVDTTVPSVTLTDTRTLPAGGGYASSVDVNGQGTMVVATVAGPSTLSLYTVDHAASALVEVPTSPTVVLTNPRTARFNPAGTFLFTANISSDTVSVFGVTPAGVVTEQTGSPYPTGGTTATGLAIDALGARLYVANKDSNNVSAFAIDATTGALTAAAGSPFLAGVGPESLSVDRSTSLVLVSNRGSTTLPGTTVSIFNSGVGAVLTPVSGSPFTVGSEPAEIGFGP